MQRQKSRTPGCQRIVPPDYQSFPIGTVLVPAPHLAAGNASWLLSRLNPPLTRTGTLQKQKCGGFHGYTHVGIHVWQFPKRRKKELQKPKPQQQRGAKSRCQARRLNGLGFEESVVERVGHGLRRPFPFEDPIECD